MMNAIVVDDELFGRETLAKMLERFCPEVEMKKTCENVAQAKKAIEVYEPDLVFLDIEMPLENGFKLLDYYPDPDFYIVFVTAHQHYAIKAFEYAAIDYLVKPIDYDELQRAVARAKKRFGTATSSDRVQLLKDSFVNPFRKIAIPTMKGYILTEIEEIIRAESDVNYSKIVLSNQQVHTSSKTLLEYEKMLSPFNFLRVHRSHLINLNYVVEYRKGKSPTLVMADGTDIPVSRSRRAQVLGYFN